MITTLTSSILIAAISGGVLWLWLAAIGDPVEDKVDEGEIFSFIGFFLVRWKRGGFFNAIKGKEVTVDQKNRMPKMFGLCSVCCSPWIGALVCLGYYLYFKADPMMFIGPVFLTHFFYSKI